MVTFLYGGTFVSLTGIIVNRPSVVKENMANPAACAANFWIVPARGIVGPTARPVSVFHAVTPASR
jgi:hypothetical protein